MTTMPACNSTVSANWARRSRRHPAWAGVPALIILLAAAGCATIGHDFPVERVAEIRLQETTRAQIGEMFGEPWRTGIEDGQPTWTFARYHYSLFGQPSTRDLVVRFDDRGKVVSYTFNTTEREADAGQ
jgi:hypothetical protein